MVKALEAPGPMVAADSAGMDGNGSRFGRVGAILDGRKASECCAEEALIGVKDDPGFGNKLLCPVRLCCPAMVLPPRTFRSSESVDPLD